MDKLYEMLLLNKELVDLYKEYVAEHGFTEEAYDAAKKSSAKSFEMICKRLDKIKSISDMNNESVREEVETFESLLLELRAEIEFLGKEELAPS